MAIHNPRRSSGSTLIVVLIALAVIAAAGWAVWHVWIDARDPLVVYCAHDAVYAEQILRDFERETGIPVEIRFDTEATKSLGLVNLLIQEKDDPRCDVFWNNEQLGMYDLKRQGVLQPYKGEGYERIPRQYKDKDGYWTGFAARMRVWIVNTDNLAGTQQAIDKAQQRGDLSRLAIAKPLYGTTRTHYTVLWHHWGGEKLKAWHADWRRRGVTEGGGNSKVKNLVAAGTCDLGLTDTDDFYVAVDEDKPVAMVPFQVDDGRVICIPNTVAIVKGTDKLDAAKKLVDCLLSKKTELMLARSKSRQIPLGPVDDDELPDQVRRLKALVPKGYPLNQLEDAAEQCLNWLRSEYNK